MRYSAVRLGWLSMLAALVGILVASVGRSVNSLTAIVLGLVIAVFGLAVGVLGLRTGVRTDSGLAQSLFGMSFGFVAVVLSVFLLGAARGGVYSG